MLNSLLYIAGLYRYFNPPLSNRFCRGCVFFGSPLLGFCFRLAGTASMANTKGPCNCSKRRNGQP
ncbi:TPA: hypothetical protein OE668_003396 [Escherichia coli]|nr:hypothetical protein [Escherichia coli]MCX3809208.1 hypothetical protein [Escherichia coli]HCP6845146.1 hypothetical protein [Escherichia coli]HCT5610919.1 hypothetical protein [Escherichia coli]